jgi:uncharacterized membrane protein
VNNWKVIFATAVIFGAGVVTGGLLVNYVQQSHPRLEHRPAAAPKTHPAAVNSMAHPAEAGKPRLPEVLNRQFMQRLDGFLHLAPEQRQAIQKIIGEGQNQMRKVVQDARLEIRDVLAPEQRRKFDELVRRPFRKPLFGTNAPAAMPPVTNEPAL